jgi:hypothetical protein
MKELQVSRRRVLIAAGAVGVLGALGGPGTVSAEDDEGDEREQHERNGTRVRWDIIHVLPVPPGAGSVLSAGGEAFAFAYHTPTNPSSAQIRLTGSGTFVAPAGGGPSGSAKGGGTWQTSGAGLPTGSGTYRVTRLVSWAFANFQFGDPGFVDHIGEKNETANGSAVLLIKYDDGSDGILGIGCHGPGAPNGIVEGVIASKGYVTYWNAELPTANVDKNRTLFHVRR